MDYLLIANESQKEYTLKIQVDDKDYKNLSIISNAAGTYDLYFEDSGFKTLKFIIVETNT
jgi:hypothetical protein